MTAITVLLACALHKPVRAATSVVVNTVAARSEDVSSVDGLMRAFYEVVNVAPDAPRQWDRDRTLYAPWVRFVATSENAKGESRAIVWTHQAYVEASEPLVRAGFKEWEIGRKVRTYGNIAHIDSAYAGEANEDGKKVAFRGLNSIEAYFDGKRWWITSVIWMSESPKHPLPRDLVP